MSLLDDLVARCEAATAGPWELFANDDDVIGKQLAATYPNGYRIIRTPLHDPAKAGIDTSDEWANADFIAHARTDLPALAADFRVVAEALLVADSYLDVQLDEVTAALAVVDRWLGEGT